jgi:Zn finger protein HypA/HybF involved in hydrogenase expression
MSRLLDSFRRLLQRQPEASGKNSPAAKIAITVVDEDTVMALMRLVEKTNEGEYSCEETFDLLDEYVELAAADQDLELLMPLVKKHVDHCPDCGPRYEILLDILRNT